MNRTQFLPNPPDSAGVVTWVHFGDLHMQMAEDQNYKDLLGMVHKVNTDFAKSISFVMLPGDVANEGSKEQYAVVRSALDQLTAPWCAIVGDHDVHEKSFANFLEYMQPELHYGFGVGSVHFFALNAFSEPFPESFVLSDQQLDTVETALAQLPSEAHIVLFLHCYPSDLNQGGDWLRRMIKTGRILLIDMGHTHYNELANDGNTLYSATRSSGQIEEGPVGFSVTNIDGDVVSWKFMLLSRPSHVMITSPADYRLRTNKTAIVKGNQSFKIRAKVWGCSPESQVQAELAGRVVCLGRIQGSDVFEGELMQGIEEGVYELIVTISGGNAEPIHDKILVRVGSQPETPHPPHDVENALDAWPDHGLLGTRLGPNRNGRKW